MNQTMDRGGFETKVESGTACWCSHAHELPLVDDPGQVHSSQSTLNLLQHRLDGACLSGACGAEQEQAERARLGMRFHTFEGGCLQSLLIAKASQPTGESDFPIILEETWIVGPSEFS